MSCLIKFFLLLTMVIMAMAINTELEHPRNRVLLQAADGISGRGFFGQNQPGKESRNKMTCNNYPRMCRVKGSPGPDCCKKKCVNVSTDRLNCGKCGLKCKYYETCCKGKCVNPFSNKKHCGGCNNKCKNGSSCMYGMCSYAQKYIYN